MQRSKGHQTRRCPLCGVEYDTREQFEHHYQRDHHRLSRHACAGCGAEFETREELERFLSELTDQVAPHLEGRARVRFV